MSNCSLSADPPYQCNPSCSSSQAMPRTANVAAIPKPDAKGACESTCTCEANLRVGPVPEELVSEWVLGSLGGGGGSLGGGGGSLGGGGGSLGGGGGAGSWVRARGLVGAWARG